MSVSRHVPAGCATTPGVFRLYSCWEKGLTTSSGAFSCWEELWACAERAQAWLMTCLAC